jgi:hypothetical protein
MLLAMGAYEGGAHALILPLMPFRGGGGGVPCAQVLIRYLVTLTPKGTLIASKWFLNIVASAGCVCLSTIFPTPLWGKGCWGLSTLYIFNIWVY